MAFLFCFRSERVLTVVLTVDLPGTRCPASNENVVTRFHLQMKSQERPGPEGTGHMAAMAWWKLLEIGGCVWGGMEGLARILAPLCGRSNQRFGHYFSIIVGMKL